MKKETKKYLINSQNDCVCLGVSGNVIKAPQEQKNSARMNKIDIDFDFREESKGRDPDRWSPTLQEYHRIVWSKSLPNGKVFTLNKTSQNRLYHKSELGEFLFIK